MNRSIQEAAKAFRPASVAAAAAKPEGVAPLSEIRIFNVVKLLQLLKRRKIAI